MRCDHTRVADVEALVARIRADHGHLDVVVDSVWGGDELAQWGTPFWELDLARVAPMIERAVTSHVVTARLTTPLLLDRDALIVQVTDGDALYYRGNLVYDLVKLAVARLAFAICAHVDADILIVDEALSVGDEAFAQKCENFIAEFSKRGTILVVSHGLDYLRTLCDRVIWIDAGVVREVGDPDEIIPRYKAAVRKDDEDEANAVIGGGEAA